MQTALDTVKHSPDRQPAADPAAKAAATATASAGDATSEQHRMSTFDVHMEVMEAGHRLTGQYISEYFIDED
jgi:hypothetical protein